MQILRSSTYACLAVAIATFVLQQSAHAEEAASTASQSTDQAKQGDKSAASTSEAESADKPKGRVLEGGVKGTAVPIEEGLARIDAAGSQIQESCMQIIKEAGRKDTIVVRGPNVVGAGIVIPAIGGQGGVMQMGEMPIRRDRLERYMNNSEQSITALQSYVDALMVPNDNGKAQLAYTDLKAQMASAQDHLSRLKELAAMKRLSNMKIGREALAIHDAIAAMQRDRSQLAQMAPALTVTEPAP
jgi:hypothetical protein